jgi:hypothetical protein
LYEKFNHKDTKDTKNFSLFVSFVSLWLKFSQQAVLPWFVGLQIYSPKRFENPAIQLRGMKNRTARAATICHKQLRNIGENSSIAIVQYGCESNPDSDPTRLIGLRHRGSLTFK